MKNYENSFLKIKGIPFTHFFGLLFGLFVNSQILGQKESSNAVHNNSSESLLIKAQEFLNKDLDSALFIVNTIIASESQSFEEIEIARAHSIKGEIYQRKNQYLISIRSYLRAIQIGKKTKHFGVLGSAYNGLGITFYLMQDYQQAEKYIRLSLSAKLKQKDYVFYAVVASNLAALLVHNKKNNEALEILLRAAEVAEKNSLELYLPNIYNSIGAIYFQIPEKRDSSLYFYQKSITGAERMGVTQNLMTGYHNIGQLFKERKNHKSAIKYLLKADSLSIEMNSIPLSLKSAQTLAETYEEIGDYKNALKFREQEINLSKQLFDSTRQKSIQELEIKYKTAEKDKLNLAQEKEIIKTKLSKQKSQFFLTSIIFILILIATVIFIGIYARHQKSNVEKLLKDEKLKLFENITHDIRTPVSLISGPLQALKKNYSANQEDAIHFELIERNSEKLINMVQELLDVSKIDQGKFQIEWNVANLDEFLEFLVNDFDIKASEKRIKLQFVPEIPSGNYRFPKNIIEKTIFNLLSNALKYAPKDSTVVVSAKIQNNQIYISVIDQGSGIPKSEATKIFHRFYRLKKHEKTEGTGLGLSLVKEILALAGGSINLNTENTGETEFFVTLPIEKLALESTNEENNDSKSIQLLICDDAQDLLQFLNISLSPSYKIVCAKNGLEAIKKIQENVPDIILSDVMMPKLDGLQLIQELKKNALWASVPVILFSAKTSLENRLSGLKIGADYYIQKPFNLEELKIILQNIAAKIEKERQLFEDRKIEKIPFEQRLVSENSYVNKALELVIQNIENPAYSVNELASDLCVSRSQLHRKISLYTGYSASHFMRMIRLEKAKDLLEANFGNVEEVAFACGFSSRSYFSSSFADYFGQTPSEVLGNIDNKSTS